MACTQCRNRKLRCDREYPTCTRCLKSRTPTKCTYEDGFLWQQPATVATSFTADPGSTSISQAEQVPFETPPGSGLGPSSTRSDALVSNNVPVPDPGPRPTEGPHHKGRHKERGFLETVLGAPKAVANQEPFANTDLVQRPRRAIVEPEPFASRVDEHADDEGLDDDLSPSHQLDLAPRMTMRGRETKTRFSGSGIYAHLVAQVCS